MHNFEMICTRSVTGGFFLSLPYTYLPTEMDIYKPMLIDVHRLSIASVLEKKINSEEDAMGKLNKESKNYGHLYSVASGTVRVKKTQVGVIGRCLLESFDAFSKYSYP